MSGFVLRREYALQLPNNYVDVDREEMEYVDGGDIYISNSTLNGIALAIGINPIPAVLAYLGYAKLKGLILGGIAILSAKIGVVSKVAGAVVMLSGGLTAAVVANALIQRKGISIDWMRSGSGIIYGIDVSLR